MLKTVCAIVKFTDNTELNNLRKIICLRKFEVCKKKGSNVIDKLVEHGIKCLPCSYTNDVIAISSQQL